MDGLTTQLRLLHAALRPLDLAHPPTDDAVVSELQVTLARATALAKRVSTRQHTLVPLDHNVEQRGKEPTSTSSQQPKETSSRAKKPASAAPPTEGGDETLQSIAAALHVSVEELRKWNPQLPSTIRDLDVLPANTYLKVRPALPAPPLKEPTVNAFSNSSNTSEPVAAAALAVSPLLTSAPTSRPSAHRSQPVETTQRLPRGSTASSTTHPQAASLSHSNTRNSLGGGTSASLFVKSGSSGSLAFPRGSEGGSPGRGSSCWAGESGRGASHSPQMPEPSIPNGDASAGPPAYAPAPTVSALYGIVEVGSLAEAESGPTTFSAASSTSPSPERHSVPSGSSHPRIGMQAAVDREATKSEAAHSPSVSAALTAPAEEREQLPPPSAAAAPPTHARQSSSPRHSSRGGSTSALATPREIRTRGHSRSVSSCGAPNGERRACASTSPLRGAGTAAACVKAEDNEKKERHAGTTATTTHLADAPTHAVAAAGVLKAGLRSSPSKQQKAGDNPQTERPQSAPPQEQRPLTREDAEEGKAAGARVRDASQSFSAVSTPSSSGGEAGHEGIFNEAHHAEASDWVPLEAEEAAAPHHAADSPLFQVSRSLGVLTSALSASPAMESNDSAGQKKRNTSADWGAPSATRNNTISTTGVAPKPDNDFATPTQQRKRSITAQGNDGKRNSVPGENTKGAPVKDSLPQSSLSPLSQVSVSPSQSRPNIRTEDTEGPSPHSHTEERLYSEGDRQGHYGNEEQEGDSYDDDDDEEEDTPSMRVPATLGRPVCSPPPTLSRPCRKSSGEMRASPVAAHPPSSSSPPPPPPPPATATSKPAEHAERAFIAVKAPDEVASIAKEASVRRPASTRSSSSPVSRSLEDVPLPSPARSVAKQDAEFRRINQGEAEAAPSRLPLSSSPPIKTPEEAVRQAATPHSPSDTAYTPSPYLPEESEDTNEQSGEGDEEDAYDTLEGIAAAYGLTVDAIVEWNPYLKKYTATEPLPPDLPIVLPMPDEEDGEEEYEADETVSEDLRREARKSSTPPSRPAALAEDSPVPVRPIS